MIRRMGRTVGGAVMYTVSIAVCLAAYVGAAWFAHALGLAPALSAVVALALFTVVSVAVGMILWRLGTRGRRRAARLAAAAG